MEHTVPHLKLESKLHCCSLAVYQDGRFIWQEVGVEETYGSKAFTTAKLKPVFSSLYGSFAVAFVHLLM
jgi:hypothetical protein